MPRKELKVVNHLCSVSARELKYFGTAVISSMTVRMFFAPNAKRESFIVCGCMAGIAGALEILNIKYDHSKKVAKAYRALLKSERFLDFIMLFRTLYDTSYHLLEQQYPAIIISSGITIPFALWRAHKYRRCRGIEDPLTLFIYKRLGGDFELNTFPLPRQVSSHRFSLQGFGEFKRLRSVNTDTESATQQSDDELLHEYFNIQMGQYSFFSRYVLMDALSYGAEIAGIVGYVMFVIQGVFEISNPILNFGLAAFFFIAGTLVGYKIEKIKNLLFDIYTSDFARDNELQGNIHDLLIDLYTKVTVNARRFAKVAEFLKNMLASFIGLEFAYVAIAGGEEVNDYYTLTAMLFSVLVGVNSIYNVQRQQDEMLLETGAKSALERLERRESSAVAEIESITPAAQVQTITTPPKGEKSGVTGQLPFSSKDSPESSASSASDDSPPRSLPSRSPPPSLERPAEASSVRSAPGDLLMERREATHKKPRGWFDGWSSFFGSRRGERVESLRIPLVPPDERSADPEISNGMLAKPA